MPGVIPMHAGEFRKCRMLDSTHGSSVLTAPGTFFFDAAMCRILLEKPIRVTCTPRGLLCNISEPASAPSNRENIMSIERLGCFQGRNRGNAQAESTNARAES